MAESSGDPIATLVDADLATPARDEPVARGMTIGRYVVLGELGTGGMGLVVSAYDPELDRKVAIKILREHLEQGERASAGRARLMREAQAMARLNHPGVVTVHDVGTFGGRVFIAMEFVDGLTLRAWIESRSPTWREVVGVLIDAGRGLAAAHAAGLLHRDFKPDNVMIGRDDRVRVMDFGVARAVADTQPNVDETPTSPTERAPPIAVTRKGTLIGTPAYMAPEQISDGTLDPRTDQFAFAVTLWEALYGQRPFGGESLLELATNVLAGNVTLPPSRSVPTWVRKVLLRALRRTPDDRFASMEDLLAALARDPSRARRRIAAVAGIAVVASGAWAWTRIVDERAHAQCEMVGRRIEEVWNADAREQVRAAILATGAIHAPVTADKLGPWLDDYASSWQQARTAACTEVPADPRADECLHDAYVALRELVDALVRIDGDAVHNVVAYAAGLPPIAICRDPRALASRPRLPTDPQVRAHIGEIRERIVRQGLASRMQRSRSDPDDVRTILDDAREIDWPPLVAEALLLASEVADRSGDFTAARAYSMDAYFIAGTVAADDLAANAAIDLVGILGDRLAQLDDALVWARHAEMLLQRLGEDDGRRAWSLAGQLGNVHLRRGEFEIAITYLQRALELKERYLGPDHPAVAATLNNLGNAYGDRGEIERAVAAHVRALAIREAALGPQHRQVADSLANLGHVLLLTADRSQGLAHLQRALAILEGVVGPEHRDVAAVWLNIARANAMLGDRPVARAASERALAILERAMGPEHPDFAIALANVGGRMIESGEHEDALPYFRRAFTILENALGPEHPLVADAATQIGDILVELGRSADAIEPLRRAVAITEQHPTNVGSWGLARFGLARAQYDGGDRSGARALAQSARDAFARQGEPYGEQVGLVDAWLLSHP